VDPPLTSHRNAAVWLDHHEARVFHVDLDGFDASRLETPHRHVHRHPKGAAEAHEHPDDMNRFFGDVARALDDAERVLVVGPSTAKLQFLKYVHAHDAKLEPRIVGVETVDHPTDPQLVAYAQRYFDVAPLRVR
jgi:stalled ribosome rescue protein Dom34